MSAMICERCGKVGIYWEGPLSVPERMFTKCPHCGGVNCQRAEGSPDEAEPAALESPLDGIYERDVDGELMWAKLDTDGETRAQPDKPTRQPEFYSCRDDDERLTHTEIADAVLDYLDDVHPDRPATVTVNGYAVRVVDRGHYAERALDSLLENLHEEYGDPDSYPSDSITDPMKTAARAFLDAVLAEYRVWTCEKVCEEVVDLAPYYREAEGGGAVQEDRP